jgi:hypothetical protein
LAHGRFAIADGRLTAGQLPTKTFQSAIDDPQSAIVVRFGFGRRAAVWH